MWGSWNCAQITQISVLVFCFLEKLKTFKVQLYSCSKEKNLTVIIFNDTEILRYNVRKLLFEQK